MYSFNAKAAVFDLIHWTNDRMIVSDSGDKGGGIHGTSMKDLLAVYSDGEERLMIDDVIVTFHSLYTASSAYSTA